MKEKVVIENFIRARREKLKCLPFLIRKASDLKQFNTIRDKLAAGGVPYKYKVKNQLGQSRGVGTIRGNTGSFGNRTDQMYQYEILVYRKDLDKAKYVLGRS